jgi:probable rRNA maturation factor
LVTFEKHIEGASERSIARFVASAQRAVGLRGKVNVMVTSSRSMREMNRRFRAKNKATDVLSFPAAGLTPCELAGDIAISAEIAANNARRLGHQAAVEVKILVLHGLLHLAGYDHEVDSGRMARKEQELRRALRLPDGLIERTSGQLLGSTGKHARTEQPLPGNGANKAAQTRATRLRGGSKKRSGRVNAGRVRS